MDGQSGHDNTNKKAVIVTARPALILMVFAQMFGAGLFQAQSANIIGSWEVEITFGNGESRSVAF